VVGKRVGRRDGIIVNKGRINSETVKYLRERKGWDRKRKGREGGCVVRAVKDRC
jgi:hypothetical protein